MDCTCYNFQAALKRRLLADRQVQEARLHQHPAHKRHRTHETVLNASKSRFDAIFGGKWDSAVLSCFQGPFGLSDPELEDPRIARFFSWNADLGRKALRHLPAARFSKTGVPQGTITGRSRSDLRRSRLAWFTGLRQQEQRSTLTVGIPGGPILRYLP